MCNFLFHETLEIYFVVYRPINVSLLIKGHHDFTHSQNPRAQGFMQDKMFASHTFYGGHMDVNC